MSGFFDTTTIPIPCSKCGRKTDKTIGWLKSHKKFSCVCGTVIEVESSQFLREMAKTDRAIVDFKRKLEMINKRR